MCICNVVWLLSRQRTSHNGIYEYFIPVATERLQHKVCLKYHIFVVVFVVVVVVVVMLLFRINDETIETHSFWLHSPQHNNTAVSNKTNS